MKLRISLSGEIVPGGVYVSVKPIGVCVDKLRWLFKTAQDCVPNIDELKMHCTVLYSRNKNNACGVPSRGQPVYIARIKEFSSWIGHDDKPYVVCLLDCPELQAEFDSWVRLGYTVDFPEYKPHITVAKGLDADKTKWVVDRLNANLKKDHPFVITFGRPEIEPLRD